MSERPPALTAARRKEIETRLGIVKGVDPFAGDPQSEPFQRVMAIGWESLAKIKKMEATFVGRMDQAARAGDTGLMLAAIYGLQKDMSGTVAPSEVNSKALLHRAMAVLSRGQIDDWFGQIQGISADSNLRRSLVEYMDAKLEELDGLVIGAQIFDGPEEDNVAPAP